MSTRKDVEKKLRAMDNLDLSMLAQTLDLQGRYASGGGDEAFIRALLKKYDKNPAFQVPLLRELDLPTADEARTDAATGALAAAERSAVAAEGSAKAAVRSATAAEKSEQHAKSMKHARWVAIGLSSAALLIAAVHIIVNIVIALTKGQR